MTLFFVLDKQIGLKVVVEWFWSQKCVSRVLFFPRNAVVFLRMQLLYELISFPGVHQDLPLKWMCSKGVKIPTDCTALYLFEWQ